MPIYPVTLTVPADTPETAPVEVDVEIEEHRVTEVSVHYPNGCADMVHVALFYGIRQIAPRPEGATLVGNDETIRWLEKWDAPETPCKLTFKAWSPGTSYQHVLPCRVETEPEVEREERLVRITAFEKIIKFIKDVVGV